MPRINVVFVWHMHQPFYRDLATGEYQLPWTRMHALKDYYGMVRILEEFPKIRQTFNLVPSMMLQIEEYAAGKAQDPFLRRALQPAEELSAEDQSFLLKYFFFANPARMIYRFPRYGELFDAWRAGECNPEKARRFFHLQDYRDLQVLSQVAWFDEEFLAGDAEVRTLVMKGRDYTLADQALMGRKQLEILAKVLPIYRKLADSGQIEISMTPFYHPILPLLCDSHIASVAHPNVPLPRRFEYPQDARYQIETARDFAKDRFGFTPDGMWPSEGSVSDQTLALAADAGVKWMATDNGVLGASLGRIAGIDETYRPWVWRRDGREMRMLFRDHFLSDLIGFVYSRMEPAAAAHHFLDRIRENSQRFLDRGEDALVPVILDGENAWEHFEENGRPFLRELYKGISNDPSMAAVTVREAFSQMPAAELTRIHPGSWINANFDIWIGSEEDNRAWSLLIDAREAYEREISAPGGSSLPEEQRRLAYEELMIAEGSDWFWWYGPEHYTENRAEFDKLFRDHVAQVYRALRLTPPEALSRPIVRIQETSFHQRPAGLVKPTIEGDVSSYFEWLGAGVYAPDRKHGSMHGGEKAIAELRYGSDGSRLFVRVDFSDAAPGAMAGAEIRSAIECAGGNSELQFQLTSDGAQCLCHLAKVKGAKGIRSAPDCAYRKLFEVSVPLKSLGADPALPLRFQLSLWRDGLPVDAVPSQGWIEFVPGEPGD